MGSLRIILGQTLEGMKSIHIYLWFSLTLRKHLSILNYIRMILFDLLVKLIYKPLNLSRLDRLSGSLVAVAIPPLVAGVINHW